MMKGKESVSSREEEILSFIVRYCQERGYPPTVREIGKAVGLRSSCSVHYHLKKLEEKGLIRRKPSKPRAIELLSQGEEALSQGDLVFLPLLKSIVQEEGGIHLDFAQAFFPFPRHLLGEGTCFVLRVQNGTFNRWHILEGDYLLVEREGVFEEENLVLVFDHGRVFLERMAFWEGEKRENIVGKIVGVWRKL
jgi:repressor LexA